MGFARVGYDQTRSTGTSVFRNSSPGKRGEYV